VAASAVALAFMHACRQLETVARQKSVHPCHRDIYFEKSAMPSDQMARLCHIQLGTLESGRPDAFVEKSPKM
jgi:hypothetical protein